MPRPLLPLLQVVGNRDISFMQLSAGELAMLTEKDTYSPYLPTLLNMSTTVTSAASSASLAHVNYDGLIQAAKEAHTKPLWAEMAKLNPPLPNPTCIPHIWRYEEVRPALLRAGELVTEKQAERRVLMLVNPNRGMSSLHALI